MGFLLNEGTVSTYIAKVFSRASKSLLDIHWIHNIKFIVISGIRTIDLYRKSQDYVAKEIQWYQAKIKIIFEANAKKGIYTLKLLTLILHQIETGYSTFLTQTDLG